MAFDPPTFGAFLRALPVRAWRHAGKQTSVWLKNTRRRSADKLTEEAV
jgi:hypothetical protein